MELKVYFPEDFSDSETIDQNALQIKLANQYLEDIINDKYSEDEISEIETQILKKNAPNIWNVYVEGNIDQKLEVDFRVYSISVSDHLGVSVDNMTVFDFYSAIRYLKQKQKSKKNG